MFGEPEFHATARMSRDGGVSLKVTGVRSYGAREVSVTEEVVDEKLLSQLSAVFEKAVKASSEALSKMTAKDAATAVYVAGQRDEEI